MTGPLDLALLTGILAATLRIATPLLLSAMGELVTQRAGVWNLGVEGTMLTGAFSAWAVVVATGSPSLAALAGLAAGAAVGALTAALIVGLRLDHFVTGFAVNLAASGLTAFLFRSAVGSAGAPSFPGLPALPLPVLSEMAVMGPVLTQRGLTWAALLLVPATALLLHRTRPGLELRALGERPQALSTRGLAVAPRLWGATVVGSALTGLGGAFLLLAMSDRFLPDLTAGRGWLVVVAIVAGGWRPWGVAAAVVVFALLEAVAIHAQVLALPVPRQALLAAPYLASIAVLMAVRARSGQPARLGEPWVPPR